MALIRALLCRAFRLIGKLAAAVRIIDLFAFAAALLFIDPILRLLQIPDTIYTMMREYLWIIFWGIFATFVYNFFFCLNQILLKFFYIIT